jgi:hypothetical protein
MESIKNPLDLLALKQQVDMLHQKIAMHIAQSSFAEVMPLLEARSKYLLQIMHSKEQAMHDMSAYFAEIKQFDEAMIMSLQEGSDQLQKTLANLNHLKDYFDK